jgi:GLPGLI family protein
VCYNHLFDRGTDIKQYDASLFLQGDKSLFTMKRNDKIEAAYQSNYFDASPYSLFTVYKDFESNSLLFDFFHLHQGNTFYADTLHPMDWKLESEEKTVGGIPCKRATVRFKGRDYVAWYAPSIPILNGPWKLGGLPGLILEAGDTNGECHVQYAQMRGLGFINVGYFEKLVNKGVLSLTMFVSDLKNVLKRMTGSLSGQGDADCFTCESKSLVKLYMWEKID